MAAAATAALRKNKARPQGLALDVEKVFDEFDRDGSGDMDLKELKTALRSLNINATDTQITQLMDKFAAPEADSLDIETFNNLVNALRGTKPPATPKRGTDAGPLPPSQELPVSATSTTGPSKQSVLQTMWRSGDNFLPGQKIVHAAYQHWFIVFTVAALIMANFIINIIEKEIDPSSIKYLDTWESLDLSFNIIFLVELLFNMYSCGGPFKPFWSSGWNVFDFIIVMIGMILLGDSLPPQLSKLKLLRAFRIFRLFKRIKSLNKIVVAIIRSLPGVINAFIIMLIFFCIYAILAVDLFRDFGEVRDLGSTATYQIFDTFEYVNYSIPGDESSEASLGVFRYRANPSALSQRGLSIGSEYYGSFFRALFTLFQVMTGESWAEVVARPLLFGYDPNNGVLASFYYVSFILIMQFVLVNVVVAVLLDKFVAEDPPPDEDIKADAVSDLLGDGGAPAAAPSSGSISSVQVTVGAPAASSSSLDQKLDAILGELASLKRDLAATRSEIFDLKATKNALAV